MAINVLTQVIETPISEASKAAKEMMGEVNEENCLLLIKISDYFSLGIRESLQDMADNRALAKVEQEESDEAQEA